MSDVVNSTLDATCMGKACGLGGGFDEFSEDDPGQCRVRCDCSDSKFHSPSGGTCHMYVREEGLRGLYSGLSANLIRGISGAVLLVGYDETKAIIAKVLD